MSLEDIWKKTLDHYGNSQYKVVINEEEYSYIHVSGGILIEDGDSLNHVQLGYKPKAVEITEESINEMIEIYPICSKDKEWIQALGSKTKHELLQQFGKPIQDKSKVNELLKKIEE
jgi:hypothetical protein